MLNKQQILSYDIVKEGKIIDQVEDDSRLAINTAIELKVNYVVKNIGFEPVRVIWEN